MDWLILEFYASFFKYSDNYNIIQVKLIQNCTKKPYLLKLNKSHCEHGDSKRNSFTS